MAYPDAEFNRRLVEEYRASGGRLGGQFEGLPVLLLHTTGARTGHARVNPLLYREDGGNLAVFASKGGAPRNPDWFHNLRAHPRTSVELGPETREVVARLAQPGERQRLWAAQKRDDPEFAVSERKTDREIPVVILEPVREAKPD